MAQLSGPPTQAHVKSRPRRAGARVSTHTLASAVMALVMGCAACTSVQAPTSKTELDPTVKILTQPPPAESTRGLDVAAATTAPIVTSTNAPSGTVVQLPQVTDTPLPTDTAIPPTQTAAPTDIPPTDTPVPSPTPSPAPDPILPRQIVPRAVISNTYTGFTFTVNMSPSVALPVDLNSIMPPVTPLDLPPNTINIALLGVDTRPKAGGLNTDVIIIASINPDIPAVTLLSIPRDTMAYVPNIGYRKVNSAFARGGAMLFRQTLLYNYGINVDYYAIVNFSSVVQAVQTLGGVDVVATCPLYQVFPKDPYYYADPANPLVVNRPYTDTFSGDVWQPGTAVPTQTIWIPQAGVYTLNGLQALAYVRARYGVPGGDIDRGRREQRLIRAVISKAKQLNSITKFPELYSQFERNIKTDLTLTDLLKLATLATSLDDIVIRSRFIDSAGLTSITLPIAGNLLVPNPSVLRNYLQQVLTVALNQRANEGIPIELVNATPRDDFAIAATDRLTELGFRVVNVTKAEKPEATSQVIDFNTTKKGSAIPLLQRNFGVKTKNIVDQPDAQSPVRYRIIAGADFEVCYFRAGVGQSAAAPTVSPTEAPAPDPAVEPTPEG